MSTKITVDQVRSWIDDEIINKVEQVPDEHAEFNLLVQVSGIMIHVIQRQPGGPLLVGQEIEFDERIQQELRGLSPGERGALLSQIRQALMESDVIYGFQNSRNENVSFEELHHIFIERRIYPEQASQQLLIDAIVQVWKIVRYLDDMFEMTQSITGQS